MNFLSYASSALYLKSRSPCSVRSTISKVIVEALDLKDLEVDEDDFFIIYF
jgi:hypothetical protein